MRKLRNIIISTTLLSTTACTTLNDSVKLGSTMGALAGVAAVHAGHNSAGENPSSKDVTNGALIGLALGALTSYITHKEVEKERSSEYYETNKIHFGDLPPSPFIFPSTKNKRGR